jgi:alpha-amylase/alpha-mannosidase (GH57 family)
MTTTPGYLIVLWHMHQPDYRLDPEASGSFSEPWVYLHALKDYSDMAAHLERHPRMRAVVNFSSSLLEQLHDYTDQFAGGVLRDPLLAFLRRAGDEPLAATDKRRIGSQCWRLKRETMARPHAGYALLELRAAAALDGGDEAFFETLPDAYFDDLVTWYHLAWCGEAVKRGDPVVRRLMSQGGGFDRADREALFGVVQRVVSGVLPRYRRLADDGVIELSFTPHGHPIAPLLIDFGVVREAQPDAPLPASPAYPGGEQRLRWHIAQSLQTFERSFGRRPAGMWPAELAVSDAVVRNAAEVGLDWMVIDQSALAGVADDTKLNSPWRLQGVRSPLLFARGRKLSEFIGYEYSRRPPAEAAQHLVDGIADGLRNAAGVARPVVCLMLDGENAWEHYAGNAHDFFEALYTGMVASSAFRPVTPAQYLAGGGASAAREVASLRPGSWGTGFEMWMGDERRNAAWDALCALKRAFDAAAPSLPAELRLQAERALGQCESSDWFWWMGFDEPRDAVLRFDRAFRELLQCTYALIGMPPPAMAQAYSRLGHALHAPVAVEDLALVMSQAIAMNMTVPVPEGDLTWNTHGERPELLHFLADQRVQGWMVIVPALDVAADAAGRASFKYAEIKIALEKSGQRFFEGRAALATGEVHAALLVIGVDRVAAQGLTDRFRLLAVPHALLGERAAMLTVRAPG